MRDTPDTHDDYVLLEDLKDYADKLFPVSSSHREEGRGQVLSSFGGISSGMHNAVSKLLDSLHPYFSLPTCRECPQYSEKLVYARKCYYQQMCSYPAFIGIRVVKLKLKLKALRIEAQIAEKYRQLGWKL